MVSLITLSTYDITLVGFSAAEELITQHVEYDDINITVSILMVLSGEYNIAVYLSAHVLSEGDLCGANSLM